MSQYDSDITTMTVQDLLKCIKDNFHQENIYNRNSERKLVPKKHMG